MEIVFKAAFVSIECGRRREKEMEMEKFNHNDGSYGHTTDAVVVAVVRTLAFRMQQTRTNETMCVCVRDEFRSNLIANIGYGRARASQAKPVTDMQLGADWRAIVCSVVQLSVVSVVESRQLNLLFGFHFFLICTQMETYDGCSNDGSLCAMCVIFISIIC